MRVLAVGNAYPPHHLGGHEIVWHGTSRHIREHGHETRILTTGYRRPGVAVDAAEDPDVHRELEWYWEDHEWRRLTLRQRLGIERRNAARFERHLREYEPDVIAWWPIGGMSLSLLERVRRAGMPSLIFSHDYWATYGPKVDQWIRTWARWPTLAAPAQRLTGIPTRVDLARSGRWLFNSEAARRETLRSTGLEIPDYGILSPGIDDAFLQAPREAEPPPWRWRLLYVGRVVEQKGVITAIESLPLLPEEATLRIVGDGDMPYRRALERRARELGVADRVALEPAVARDRLPEVYRGSDAVVFPVSWTEPWGLVPLEAMALGRPVVATGRGGSGDYLRDRVNALLFEALDAGALAAALQALAADPHLRGRIRAAGYETAVSHGEAAFNRAALQEMLAAADLHAARPSGSAFSGR